MSTKGKSISSQTQREIRSATFDVDDGSCEADAGSRPVESCRSFLSTEVVEDTFDQQREPKESWVNRETQTSCGGSEDVAEAVKADVANEEEELKTDHAEEDEKLTEADILEGTQDVHGGSKVNTAEDEEEAQTTKESEPDEPPEKPRSVVSPSAAEQATGKEMSEALSKDDQDADDDVGVTSEKLQEVEKWVTQKDETIKNASMGNNPSQADEDSSSVLTEHFISSKMDDQVQKHERKSANYLKVSEGFYSQPTEAAVL